MTRRLGSARTTLAVVTLAAGVLGATALGVAAASSGPLTIDINIRYSHFQPSSVTVPAGRPVTFLIHNGDPIDHEWIVGDAALHERHRSGTEPYHNSRPTEVSIDAGTTRVTTITFDRPTTLTYVCHLPGHEAYGMVGTLIVTP
ncbi:MAG: plastocyanin/azurin family copper-binding protein [Chloroflexota bacterium]|jgi:uncharacterized cupredoxin-like copper-binding protein|nr:plastocyanin/azurin family copper-binding protein [Chloroflexota bacterium]